MWQSRERTANEPPARTNNSLYMQFTTTNKSRASISTPMYTLNGENNIRNAQFCEYERYLQKQITAQQTWIDNEKLTQKQQEWMINIKLNYVSAERGYMTLCNNNYQLGHWLEHRTARVSAKEVRMIYETHNE